MQNFGISGTRCTRYDPPKHLLPVIPAGPPHPQAHHTHLPPPQPMVGLLGAAAEARFELIDLQNRTSFLCIDGDAHVDALRGAVSDRSGIPAEHLRLTCAGRELHDAMPLAGLHQNPVRVLLRLLGGKGGFGAMLRKSGKGGVKTTNFDACRDLNGRRLKHVNAEVKLREWEAQAEERKRKKQEARTRQALSNEVHVPRFDEDAYEAEMEAARNAVAESMGKALAASSAPTEARSTGAGSSAASGPSASTEDGAGPESALETSGGKRPAAAEVAQAAKAPKLWADPLAAMMAGGEGSEEESEEEAAA